MLRCPATKAVRYVGKTTSLSARFAQHLHDARTRKSHNHRACWIRRLTKDGAAPEMGLLFVVPQDMPWQVAERFFIAAALHFDFDLVNDTLGGEGGEYSDELRKQHSVTMKAAYAKTGAKERQSEAAKKSHAKPEFRARMSVAQIKRLSKPGVRERQTDAMRKWFSDPANIQAHKDQLAKPEVKAQRSASQKSSWTDPLIRERRTTGIKATFSTPDGIAAHNRCHASWANPVTREARGKQMWETRRRNLALNGAE